MWERRRDRAAAERKDVFDGYRTHCYEEDMSEAPRRREFPLIAHTIAGTLANFCAASPQPRKHSARCLRRTQRRCTKYLCRYEGTIALLYIPQG